MKKVRVEVSARGSKELVGSSAYEDPIVKRLSVLFDLAEVKPKESGSFAGMKLFMGKYKPKAGRISFKGILDWIIHTKGVECDKKEWYFYKDSLRVGVSCEGKEYAIVLQANYIQIFIN